MLRCRSSLLLLALVLALSLLPALAPAAYAAAPVPINQDQGAIDTLPGVEEAVIQIEAVGSFVDPIEGEVRNVPGFGSGFIIDPSGIAVTNNHVVTGGALFRVFVAGKDRPVNARVLGVSECYDLAVIDLQGSGYPYLAWAEGEANVATPVYSAGFPLGDPEYALTSGIISKDNANGESSWSSLDYVFMHDADINPGNSGGPLVNASGQVVGVNYASNEGANQNFAIPGVIAREVVETLRTEVNIDSLGLNGEAFDDGEFSGIFVYSVESGSPADLVGIQPGDQIVEIEGLPMGLGGGMVEYCDVLASHDRSDVLSVVVYRSETDELLEGQFNGRPLEASFDLSEEPSEADDPVTTVVDGAYEFESVSDSAGIIQLEVPTEWSDRDERPWLDSDDEEMGNQFMAAPDLEAFFNDWSIPGVIFSFSDTLQDNYSPEELLDTFNYEDDCEYSGRKEWPGDSFYAGAYDEYLDCGGSGVTAWVVALEPESGDYIVQIELSATTDADLAALDHILDTFYVAAGTTPGIIDETAGADIFTLVDVEGLQHEYTYLQEPFFHALTPATWDEVESADWVDSDSDEVIGKYTLVSADIENYRENWNQAGLQAFVLTDLEDGFDTEGAQDAVDYSDECTFEERDEHEHTIYGLTYSGHFDVYSNCKDSGNLFYTGSFVESNGDHAILIDFVALDDADDEAWEVLLQSFFLPSARQAQVNPEGFATVTDESGRISLSVPVEWADSFSGPWEVDDEVVGIEATFAKDVAAFDESWEEPGVYVNVWDDFGNNDPDDVLDEISLEDDCTYDSRFDYEGERFSGKYDLFTECGDVEGSLTAVMALFPLENDESLVVVELTMPTDADRAVLEPILNTLQVLPPAEE